MKKIRIKKTNKNSGVKYIKLFAVEVDAFKNKYTHLQNAYVQNKYNNDYVIIQKKLKELKNNRREEEEKVQDEKSNLFKKITEGEIISFVKNNINNIILGSEIVSKKRYLTVRFKNQPNCELGGYHHVGLLKIYTKMVEEPNNLNYIINIMLNELKREENDDLLEIIRNDEFSNLNKRLEKINKDFDNLGKIMLSKEKVKKDEAKAIRQSILSEQKNLENDLNAFRSKITKAQAEFIVLNSNLNNIRKADHKELLKNSNFEINKIYFNRYSDVTLSFDNFSIVMKLEDGIIQPRLQIS